MEIRRLAGIARRAGRVTRMLTTLTLATAIAVPVAAWASHQFDDVPDSNVFHDDIDWMKDNKVTAGCNPPANDEYCPAANVTREQMAAFMHRLETEGVFLPGDPIEDWHDVGTAGEPAFNLDWDHYGLAYREVGFRMDRDGVVHLRGGATRGSNESASAMFRLPDGYRPGKTLNFAVGSVGVGGSFAGGMIEIQPDGDVIVASSVDDRYVSLNGIYFDTLG